MADTIFRAQERFEFAGHAEVPPVAGRYGESGRQQLADRIPKRQRLVQAVTFRPHELPNSLFLLAEPVFRHGDGSPIEHALKESRYAPQQGIGTHLGVAVVLLDDAAGVGVSLEQIVDQFADFHERQRQRLMIGPAGWPVAEIPQEQLVWLIEGDPVGDVLSEALDHLFCVCREPFLCEVVVDHTAPGLDVHRPGEMVKCENRLHAVIDDGLNHILAILEVGVVELPGLGLHSGPGDREAERFAAHFRGLLDVAPVMRLEVGGQPAHEQSVLVPLPLVGDVIQPFDVFLNLMVGTGHAEYERVRQLGQLAFAAEFRRDAYRGHFDAPLSSEYS